MTKSKLIIGSRGSDLARYQANFIRDKLTALGVAEVEIKIIKTTGDKIDHLSFDKMEGKGFFTKELEEALLAEEIDLAVHSLKDLMTTQPEGLRLGAVGFRVNHKELLLVKKESVSGESLIPVKSGGVIGTSSARRQCQIHEHNPNLTITDLRGNVPTRINKLRDGKYDAIIIAAAGVERLKLDVTDLATYQLDPELFLPAPAQGILGIQIRSKDEETLRIVEQMNNKTSQIQSELERGLLSKFLSGCTLPLGVISEVKDDQYRLKAVLGISENSEWTGLKRVDLTGSNTKEMVEQAFKALQE